MQLDCPTGSSLIVEYWKLLRASARAAVDLPAGKAEKVHAQLRYSAGRLDQLCADADVRLVCFDGEVFSSELPVSAINAEDVGGSDALTVDKTLEPTLIQGGKVIHTGKVLLREAS